MKCLKIALAALLLGTGGAAVASACRVSDFTDKPLSALNELQRLAFVVQMTRTEFTKLHAAAPGSPNHYPLLANAATLADAKAAAQAKLDSLKLDNVDDYAKFWQHDYLTDEQLRKYADCEGGRQPGLALYGHPGAPGLFHLTYVHITPIGIEKITTRLIASSNVANFAELEADLAKLGPQDNYVARTFVARLIDPAKPAVIIMRGGWETPKFAYIPVYPTTDPFVK